MARFRRRVVPSTAALTIAIGLLLSPALTSTAMACSGPGYADLHYGVSNAHLDNLAELAERIVRVELVAASPDARGFHRGSVAVATHEWNAAGDIEPLSLTIDDGRDRSDETRCSYGRDMGDVGTTFVVGYLSGLDRPYWFIHGSDAQLTARFGEPIPIERDDNATQLLIDQLNASRPWTARMAAHLPLGKWPLALLATATLLSFRFDPAEQAAETVRR